MPNVPADRLKRYAAALLGAGGLVAVLTPAYLIHALPGSAVYHRSPAIFVMQAIPYVLSAALWLPSRNPRAPKVAFGLSILLFAVACLLDLPQWIHPRSGGDMVGLGYILACLVLTTTILVVSLVAVVVSWWSARMVRRDA
jgi:hypothetical protein